ncbi:MAG TPA: YlxR family protein [Candidatus Saccharimonadales bacterium]|nr:YlxR family protein [Candidatus Saccharimonadales bacterium]
MLGAVHIPVRQCKICRTRRPKVELMRWVRTDEGWQRDESSKLPGRGAYTDSDECAAKLLSGKKR